MKLIVCLDDRGGMAFAGRRQSKDRCVTEDIVRDLADGVLFVTPYSAKLFERYQIRLETVSDPTSAARKYPNSTVFLETAPAPRDVNGIDAVTVYRWGRSYPFDLSFETDLSALRRRGVLTFKGNSHDKITKEIYTR